MAKKCKIITYLKKGCFKGYKLTNYFQKRGHFFRRKHPTKYRFDKFVSLSLRTKLPHLLILKRRKEEFIPPTFLDKSIPPPLCFQWLWSLSLILCSIYPSKSYACYSTLHPCPIYTPWELGIMGNIGKWAVWLCITSRTNGNRELWGNSLCSCATRTHPLELGIMWKWASWLCVTPSTHGNWELREIMDK